MKFDVVVGNPPYQYPKEAKTSKKLWIDVSMHAFGLLNTNGFIAFVTPQSWMKPNHKMLKWFKEHNLIIVETDINKWFPSVNSTFSYWVAQLAFPSNNTTINGTTVEISNLLYIVPEPQTFAIHQRVMFTSAPKFKVDTDQQTAYSIKITRNSPDLKKEQTTHCKYPIFHTNCQTFYSSTKTKNYDDAKVIFGISGYLVPRFDTGNMGTSQYGHYILVKNDIEGNILVGVLKSKLYQFIINTAKWSGFSETIVLRNLPAVNLSRSWTDNELYAHFNLSDEEIKLIEETIK